MRQNKMPQLKRAVEQSVSGVVHRRISPKVHGHTQGDGSPYVQISRAIRINVLNHMLTFPFWEIVSVRYP